jgi:hypothetical protein
MTGNVTSLDASDFAMQNWRGGEAGPVRIGSPQHLRLFTRMLLDTHNPYKPAVID